MNINIILSTKERVKILKEIIFFINEFGVIEIAKKLKLSKGLVSKYFEILVTEGILKRKKGKLIVKDNRDVKALRILLNLEAINLEILKRFKFVKAAGLYGSCTKGTNTQDSDVDLWIKIDAVNDEKIAEFISELTKNSEKLKILILTESKINKLKKADPVFYYSLFFGSIIMYGSENEI